MNKSKQLEATGNILIQHKTSLPENETVLEHFHNSYEIGFFTKADIKIFVKDHTYHLEDGDLLLINSNDFHRITYSQTNEYMRYVINFSRDFIQPSLALYGLEEDLLSIFNLENRQISTTFAQQKKIAKHMSEMDAIYKQAQGKISKLTSALLISQLILLLSTIKKLALSTVQPREINKIQNDIQTIIQYIDANFSNSLTLEEIANQVHLSKCHVSHIFKQQIGATIFDYLQYRRILQAQKLLLEKPHYTVTRICYQCGFNNIQHFYRVFKKYTNTTPKVYTQRVQETKGI